MICSTLSGHLAIKHPTIGVLVREDGFIFCRFKGNRNIYHWYKGHLDKDGYYRFALGQHPYLISRLVAQCFIPNPKSKPTVDHINRIRADNNVANLRWATYREQALNRKTTIFGDKITVGKNENSAEYNKQYYKLNRNKISEYNKQYNKVNRNKRSEYQRQYRKMKNERLRKVVCTIPG